METGQLFLEILYREQPRAMAQIYGNRDHPLLRGVAKFYKTFQNGILISVEVMGLPDSPGATCGFFAMHIHEYGNCTENFNNTGGVLFLRGSTHPYNAGALPSLMSSAGYAWTAFYDDRLNITDVFGRSIVIHKMHDYQRTPAGDDSPPKIACGVIQAAY